MAAERRFKAMGSEVHLIVNGPDRIVDHAERVILDQERRWSRFVPTSELNQVNRANGDPVIVSQDTAAVVAAAITAWQETGGLFDPTVHEALVAAGYDRSFDELVTTGPSTASTPPRPAPGCADVFVDLDVGLVRLPPGVMLDLGAIGKGAAADAVYSEILALGAEGVCINIGGDLRVGGRPPTGTDWGVELPCRGAADAITVRLTAGAVCTSTTLRRRWTDAEGPKHHVIDPRSGRPSDTEFVTASVIGASAAQCEVLATCALLDGPAALDDAGVAGVIVDTSGHIHRIGNFGDFEIPK